MREKSKGTSLTRRYTTVVVVVFADLKSSEPSHPDSASWIVRHSSIRSLAIPSQPPRVDQSSFARIRRHLHSYQLAKKKSSANKKAINPVAGDSDRPFEVPEGIPEAEALAVDCTGETTEGAELRVRERVC
jgi:hypothetical protein